VHCAHPDGLAIPIKGDELYGKKSDRLYLHAEEITFRHPITLKVIKINKAAQF
jgi:tRNA pseudouridine32 synthase/23S rRNA pseudouridine746 synthase